MDPSPDCFTPQVRSEFFGVNCENSLKKKICLPQTGYSYDPECVYVNGTGRDYYEFYIQLNRCGTLGKNTHDQDNRKQPSVSVAFANQFLNCNQRQQRNDS